MAPTPNEPITSCHVVAVPYPGRGHINAMMNLCKILTASSANKVDLLITFVITEEWLGFIGSEEKPPNVVFSTIPNVLPSELGRAADMPGFVAAIQTKMEEPFEQLLDRVDKPVKMIIADTFLGWAVDVGKHRNIPVASLWPMPVAVFWIFYNFDLLVQNGHFPFELSERGEERVDYIPGVSSISLADLPSIIHLKNRRLLDLALRAITKAPEAQYLLFSSFYEIESPVIDALKQKFSLPVYTLGPVIDYLQLEKITSFTSNQNDPEHYFEWLDSQPPSSVLYVSLGSFLSVSNEQMQEIAAGLQESGVRFLWVVRGTTMQLKEKCGDAGKIIPWCDQLKVLFHASVGAFFTHCGWNSTLEGVFSGLPMLTLPILMDQTTVSKYVVEDWRTGWSLRRKQGEDLLIRRDEIAVIITRIMDLESPERKEMMRRARDLQKLARQTITEGGSSRKNMNSFLEDITKS